MTLLQAQPRRVHCAAAVKQAATPAASVPKQHHHLSICYPASAGNTTPHDTAAVSAHHGQPHCCPKHQSSNPKPRYLALASTCWPPIAGGPGPACFYCCQSDPCSCKACLQPPCPAPLPLKVAGRLPGPPFQGPGRYHGPASFSCSRRHRCGLDAPGTGGQRVRW